MGPLLVSNDMNWLKMNIGTKIKSLLCTSFNFFDETISEYFSLCAYERYHFYQLNIFTIQSNVYLAACLQWEYNV